jgi:hypothetical protein
MTDPGDAFDTTRVDLVTLAEDGSEVRLYVVADRPWSGSDAQLDSLQRKIHNYVSFALDGQLVRQYTSADGMPWVVVVDCQTGAPDKATRDLLEGIGAGVERYGGRLEVLIGS